MKLVIFTICKDEEATIGELLNRIPKKIEGISQIETLLVSDGSTDDTVKVAKKHRVNHVIDGVKQKRLAYRFEEAAEKVLELGADIAVNIDGDLQFAPEDIPKLIRPILDEGFDFVAADRFTDPKTGEKRRPKGMPPNKYRANVLGSWIVGQLSGQKFYDVTCGFRAYSRKALAAININSAYTYTQESFQILAVKRMAIKAVPIEVKYYEGRQSRVVRSFWGFLFGSALNILRAFRDYAPLKFFGLAGLVVFIPGLIMGGFTLAHWITEGSVTPYVTVGFIGLYLVTAAFMLWALGLVADMFDRMLSNQEKIIERQKEAKYRK